MSRVTATGGETHEWRLLSEIPVLDVGRYGISTYECARCGEHGQSNCHTGALPSTEGCSGVSASGGPMTADVQALAEQAREALDDLADYGVGWVQTHRRNEESVAVAHKAAVAALDGLVLVLDRQEEALRLAAVEIFWHRQARSHRVDERVYNEESVQAIVSEMRGV